MTFNTVKKGGGFNVAKRISAVLIQLGWDAPEKVNGAQLDIDVHAFWLGGGSAWIPTASATSLALSCYNEDLHGYDPVAKGLLTGNHQSGSKHPFALDDASLIHMGDARSGTAAVNIEEEISANLTNAPASAMELSIWITIHDAATRKQHFGMMQSGFIQVVNADDPSDQQCRYDLAREFDGKSAIQVASFNKKDDGSWQFTAVGNGVNADFMQIIERLGYTG